MKDDEKVIISVTTGWCPRLSQGDVWASAVTWKHRLLCGDFLGDFLGGEEGFGESTGGVGAQGAAQGQLTGAWLVGLQVGPDQVSESLHKKRVSV